MDEAALSAHFAHVDREQWTVGIASEVDASEVDGSYRMRSPGGRNGTALRAHDRGHGLDRMGMPHS